MYIPTPQECNWRSNRLLRTLSRSGHKFVPNHPAVLGPRFDETAPRVPAFYPTEGGLRPGCSPSQRATARGHAPVVLDVPFL
eukprot:5692889-Pyramimonas_sp.AAC.1